MALTAHKPVTMFKRYVHTEDDSIRAAAETVANRRRSVVGRAPSPAPPAAEIPAGAAATPFMRAKAPTAPARLLGLEDVAYTSRTKMGNYRPYRKRKGENRAEPPKARRGAEPGEVQHV